MSFPTPDNVLTKKIKGETVTFYRSTLNFRPFCATLIVTNDMFDMTSQEFADDYYDYVLTSNEGDTELIADGYLSLINLADREYYLSTCGKAIDLYTDTVTDELFNEIQQFMVDEDYEAAVNKVIEKTIY